MDEDTPPPAASEVASDQAPAAARSGLATVEYLEQRAAESFGRQLDIEESIWRSLPFFTGALIAASAMLGYTAPRLPLLEWSLYSLATNGMLLLAVIAFAWSFRWLWEVARPRDYEYPADDSAIARYAEQMTTFHAHEGLVDTALDSAVVGELRVFMVKQLGDAASQNFANNQTRLSARSQVLLFLAVGFVLAFACECTIFVHSVVTTMRAGDNDRGAASQQTNASNRRERVPSFASPSAATGTDRARRRGFQQDKPGPTNPEQMNAGQQKGTSGTRSRPEAAGTSTTSNAQKE